MKKLLFVSIICLSVLAMLVSPALAGRYDREDAVGVGWTNVKTISSGSATGSIAVETITAPTYIYAITYTPKSTSAWACIYNSNSATGSDTTEEIEIAGVTTNKSERVVFDRPLNYDKAVYIAGYGIEISLEYRS